MKFICADCSKILTWKQVCEGHSNCKTNIKKMHINKRPRGYIGKKEGITIWKVFSGILRVEYD